MLPSVKQVLVGLFKLKQSRSINNIHLTGAHAYISLVPMHECVNNVHNVLVCPCSRTIKLINTTPVQMGALMRCKAAKRDQRKENRRAKRLTLMLTSVRQIHVAS